MPRFKPALLPPAPEVRDTRTFTDPAFPEPLTLTMRYTAGFASAQFREDSAGDLFAVWGTPNGKPILPDGEAHPIPVSRNLCWAISVLMMGDKPDIGGAFRSTQEAGGLVIEEPWAFEDWAMLSHRAGATFADIFAWADDLRRSAGGSKNASEATGETPSGPPTAADSPTPTS